MSRRDPDLLRVGILGLGFNRVALSLDLRHGRPPRHADDSQWKATGPPGPWGEVHA